MIKRFPGSMFAPKMVFRGGLGLGLGLNPLTRLKLFKSTTVTYLFHSSFLLRDTLGLGCNLLQVKARIQWKGLPSEPQVRPTEAPGEHYGEGRDLPGRITCHQVTFRYSPRRLRL